MICIMSYVSYVIYPAMCAKGGLHGTSSEEARRTLRGGRGSQGIYDRAEPSRKASEGISRGWRQRLREAPGQRHSGVGLVTGIVTGVGITVNPYIEYYADNLPERRLGVFGIGLILCGFTLQSLQYWLSLFDVRLT